MGKMFCSLLIWVSIIVIVFDYLLVSAFIRQFDSRNYLRANGIITGSEIQRRADNVGGNNLPGSHTVAIIHYSYKVNGQSLASKRYRYLNVFPSAKKITAAFPKGSKVTVFYDPKNPRDALLSPGVSNLDWNVLSILAFLNLLLVGFWSMAWIKFRRRRSSVKPIQASPPTERLP